MNTRDLFEAAQLDALGLLDDAERDAFDAAFLSAAPDIQAQLRREQARLVRTDWLPMPEDHPPAELKDAVLSDVAVSALRGRVLGAVREEMSKSPSVPSEAQSVRGGSVAPISATSHRHQPGRPSPALRPSRRVTPLWRAAALGFASAAIAFGGAFLHLRQKLETLERGYSSERALGALAQVQGVQVADVLFNAKMHRVVFAPASDDVKSRASIFINPEASTATLYFGSLAPKDDVVYCLIATDEEGHELSEIARLDAVGGGAQGQAVEFDVRQCPRLAIVAKPVVAGTEAEVTLLKTGPLLG